MSLIEDIFSENVLDQPDELEIIQESDEPDNFNLNENKDDGENKENADGNKQDDIKKRKPRQIPRLNIIRLMDKNGLTAIDRMFKDVSFKGKGHEQEDLNLIMRSIEIWAHRLFPKLQFDDCLTKLEKLGNTKPVATYVKKIRMGLEDETTAHDDDIILNDKDDDDDVRLVTQNDAFDQLISKQKRLQGAQHTTSNSISTLTIEQRERMLKNRLLAEQRRMARMKVRQQLQNQEQQQHDSDATSVIEETNTYLDENQLEKFSNEANMSGTNALSLENSAHKGEMFCSHSDSIQENVESEPVFVPSFATNVKSTDTIHSVERENESLEMVLESGVENLRENLSVSQIEGNVKCIESASVTTLKEPLVIHLNSEKVSNINDESMFVNTQLCCVEGDRSESEDAVVVNGMRGFPERISVVRDCDEKMDATCE